jgi:hypothetical protein
MENIGEGETGNWPYQACHVGGRECKSRQPRLKTKGVTPEGVTPLVFRDGFHALPPL